MKHMNLLKRLGAILLCAALMLTLSAIAVSADDADSDVKDVSDTGDVSSEPVITIGADDTSDDGDAASEPVVTIGTDDTSDVEAATEATVLVTIADASGKLVLAMEAVTVTDIDADGALTINDALYCAHETYYDGGAAAGYASAMSDYGLSLAKLWGTENGGSYGYYVNDVAAWGLADPIADNDRVNAFVYTDLTAWSDTYCYFDVVTMDAKAGDTLTLTLSAAGYDADWNPVTLPVAGATITLNGEKTDAVTDENGKATVTLSGEGTLILSAVSDTQTLVPPVCLVTLPAAEKTVGSDTAASPDTGDAGTFTGIVMLGALCVAGIALAGKRRDK